MKLVFRKISVLSAILCLAIFSVIFTGELLIPEKVVFYDGNTHTQMMAVFYVRENSKEIVSVSTASEKSITADVSILGIIPVKQISAENSQRRHVYVGGDVVGIRLYTEGLLVIGTDEVETSDGIVSPGEKCGIESGDIILSVDDAPVCSVEDFSNRIARSGGNEVKITVMRNSKKHEFLMTPVYSGAEGKFRCGLWLRDSTAGIGTLTYADPENGMFAALGHAICDSETKSVLPVGEGDILTAEISGVTKGEKGITGQIKGNFGNKILGALKENNEFGVYGTFSSDEILYGDLLPVASETEIRTGDAQILCNADGNGTECYDIEIEKITYTGGKTSRSMVIEITDEDLLEKTGGIVQGMSGSPIIQDGMLVGAVTHVFLNDPSRGYGIFAETMLSESDRLADGF